MLLLLVFCKVLLSKHYSQPSLPGLREKLHINTICVYIAASCSKYAPLQASPQYGSTLNRHCLCVHAFRKTSRGITDHRGHSADHRMSSSWSARNGLHCLALPGSVALPGGTRNVSPSTRCDKNPRTECPNCPSKGTTPPSPFRPGVMISLREVTHHDVDFVLHA